MGAKNIPFDTPPLPETLSEERPLQFRLINRFADRLSCDKASLLLCLGSGGNMPAGKKT